MVDWTSPEEIESNVASLFKLTYVMAGVYFWEYITSLDFEWSFIQGKRRFNWPMIPYFLGRYSGLFMLITAVISGNVTPYVNDLLWYSLHYSLGINCQAFETICFLFGGAMFGFASMNLAIRTMVIWDMKWACIIPLCLLSAAQCVMIIIDASVVRASSRMGQLCSAADNWAFHDQTAIILIGLSLDSLALILNIIKLLGLKYGRRTQLVNILLQDGIMYFVVSVLVNIPSAVLSLLALNNILGYISGIPAATLSTIVACRVVRRLSNFSTDGPVIYMTTTKRTAPVNVANHPNAIQVQMDGLAGSETPSSEVIVLSKNETSPYV